MAWRRPGGARASIDGQAAHTWRMGIYGRQCRRGRPRSARRRDRGGCSPAWSRGLETGAGGRRSRRRPALAPSSSPQSRGPCRRRLGHLWSGELGRVDAGRPETPMTSRTAGLRIALAAITVQAPRLVLVVLGADRQPVPRPPSALSSPSPASAPPWSSPAATSTSPIPWRRSRPGAALWPRHGCWCSPHPAALVLPLIVAGISARSVPQVLGAGRLEWTWALLAAVAHELTAAGCVLASAAWAAQAGGAGAGTAADLLTAGAALPAGGEAALPAGAAAAAALPQPAADRIPCRAGCGRSFVSQQAEIAHLRHCPRRRPSSGSGSAN
jgi:hypothetical protein